MNKKLTFLLMVILALGLGRVLCAQVVVEESWEKRINADQPPDKVLEAIGVKPGMVIGEIGAGRGRYTVHLAARVGSAGTIYAEDIDQAGLDYLRTRCRRNGITNVEIIRGTIDDPLFTPGALDMAFMILTYHHLAKPVDLLRNLIPCLKPGATVVIVDPDPVKDTDRAGRECTSREKMEKEAGLAGFEIVRVEDFLKNDNIFILRAKPGLLPFPPQSKKRTGPFRTADGRSWKVVNRQAAEAEEGGRTFVRLDERAGSGLARLEGSRFSEGTIEFDVRGKDVAQKSFVGVAFHGYNDETFEAVYFRPFNFKDPDPAKSGHSVQYVSHPDFTWQKLRTERPGEFEKPVAPVPDPNGWFHVRLDVGASRVSVYVNGEPKPCLEVDRLGNLKDGLVGFFVGNGSGGDLAGLKITPAKD